jgi:RHS repeat-associated protein
MVFRHRAVRIALVIFALCLIPLHGFGQAPGNDNPTGVAGVFNGNSTTGCSYDPYTTNATRTIPDLTVAGAVGAYPLQWARTMNSRVAGGSIFGQAGGWKHSYQWSCSAESNTTTTPSSYTVRYPDGRVVTFSTGTPDWGGPPGVNDRFHAVIGNNQDCYLTLPDGGTVHFIQTMTGPADGEYFFTISPATYILDPQGLQTTFTYDGSNRLTQVTEPAGRSLRIFYGGNGYVSEVDAYTAAGHESQWVKYTYATQTFGTTNYVVLTGANYIYAAPETQPVALYTYQQSNTSPNGYPLILTCRDVRFPGPMKNIRYVFLFNGSYGQLAQEQNVNGTMVSQITVLANQRIELRGDGTNDKRGSGSPTRTWTYGATLGSNGILKNYLLKSFTDFQGHTTTLSYDVNGHVSSVLNARGYTTNYSRLAATGAIKKITHPGDGTHVDYVYHDTLTGYYLDSVTDERGKTTSYLHFPNMATQEIDYPDLGKELFTYDQFNQVLTHTMPSNTTAAGSSTDSEKYSYDSAGRLLTYTPPATTSDPAPSPHPTTYHYDVNDHVDTITDPRGNQTTLLHNEIGQLTIEKHADTDHSQVGYAYNPDGTLAYKNVQLNATDWAETDYTYDDYKRVRTVTDPVGNATNYWYDTAGLGGGDLSHTDSNVTRVVSLSGHAVRTQYDENFRKGSVITGAGTGDALETDYTYDEVGNLTSKTTPLPNGNPGIPPPKWSYFYDARDRLIGVDDPLLDKNTASPARATSYTYDAANNKTSEQRANDQMITYDSYDEMNRLTKMTTGQSPSDDAVTYYTWTKAGKLASMTDPRLKVYNYEYDLLNRLTKSTFPIVPGESTGRSELRGYDIAGNLLTYTTRNGDVQTFTYDSRNRETKYTWLSGLPSTRNLTYDDASRMTSCNTANTFINFTYYADGQLKSQEEWTSYLSDNNHHTLTYVYDQDSNRQSLALPGTTTLGYSYTARNQLQAVTAGSASLVSYVYDPAGNFQTRTFNNSTSSAFKYDLMSRVTNITHTLSDVGDRTLQYAYDAVGNRTYEQHDGGTADGFGYDANGQLIAFRDDATLSGSNFVGGVLTILDLDGAGDRKSVTNPNGPTFYASNPLNQYATVGGQSLSYDDNGNLSNYNGTTYTYDSMNRLTDVSGGVTAHFVYDGLGRQVGRSIGGVIRFSVWDGWNLFAEYQSGNVLNRRMVNGAGGDLALDSYNNLYFYANAQGSTTHLAGSDGKLKESYTYDMNGTPTVYNSDGTLRSGGSAYISNFFTGQQWYSALKLYDLRHRFYVPDLGRFLQPDPTGFNGDPANLYRYCGNNPANLTDPSGEYYTATQSPDGNITIRIPTIFGGPGDSPEAEAAFKRGVESLSQMHNGNWVQFEVVPPEGFYETWIMANHVNFYAQPVSLGKGYGLTTENAWSQDTSWVYPEGGFYSKNQTWWSPEDGARHEVMHLLGYNGVEAYDLATGLLKPGYDQNDVLSNFPHGNLTDEEWKQILSKLKQQISDAEAAYQNAENSFLGVLEIQNASGLYGPGRGDWLRHKYPKEYKH